MTRGVPVHDPKGRGGKDGCTVGALSPDCPSQLDTTSIHADTDTHSETHTKTQTAMRHTHSVWGSDVFVSTDTRLIQRSRQRTVEGGDRVETDTTPKGKTSGDRTEVPGVP